MVIVLVWYSRQVPYIGQTKCFANSRAQAYSVAQAVMLGGDRETRCGASSGAVTAELLRIDWVFMLMFENFRGAAGEEDEEEEETRQLYTRTRSIDGSGPPPLWC
jgi:hypothetical protein